MRFGIIELLCNQYGGHPVHEVDEGDPRRQR